MLKSIINGGATTPTMLAKEIVFCHGEHAVVALPNILGAAGISATEREKPLAEIIAALQAIDDRREKTSPTDELED